MGNDFVLEIEDLSKRFGRLTVADGLSLAVQPGQVVGIIGPNGAGKSTLFAMIAGELTPDAGRVRLAGVDVSHQRPSRRAKAGIGRTYQVPKPFEQMTVFENVLVCVQQGAGLSGAEANRAAVEVLRTVGMQDHANEPAGSLLLLQRKRLEVARALATDPTVILLDEVAGGLTDREVDELVHVVRRIANTGVGVVWIEHVVRALTSTVSELHCLAGGSFIASGDPAAVLSDDRVREIYLGVDVGVDDAEGPATSVTDEGGHP